MAAMTEDRIRFIDRLARLTRGLRFHWGDPASCGDESVTVALHRDWDEADRLEYVGGVSVGPPFPEDFSHAVPWTVRDSQARIVRAGRTDHRGSFFLRGLPHDDYCFEVEPLAGQTVTLDLAGPQRRELMAVLRSLLSEQPAMSAATGLFEEFHSESAEAWIRQTATGVVLEIEVELDEDQQAERTLARFRLCGPQSELLLEGYVGLKDLGNGRAFGSIFLDDLGVKLDPGRIPDTLKPPEVVLVPANSLEPRDRPALQRSAQASEGPSRDAIARILQNLPSNLRS
jgi:hypothetical protein